MEKQRLKIEKALKIVRPRLTFPDDRDLLNAYDIYKPSFESENLLSEEGRTLFAEAFKFADDDNDTKENDEETEKHYDALTLHDLALNEIIKNYHGGPLSDQMSNYDKILFGHKCNIEIQLIKLVDLDNEIFWKRVSEKKCRNRYIYHKLNNNFENSLTWKQFGMESKLSELFEYTKPDNWDEANLENTMKAVSDYVEYIQINQLMPLKNLDLIAEDPSFKIINSPMYECHHGDLSILADLKQLKMIQIEFGVENLEFDFDERYFEFSYDDVKNLSKALKNLPSLRQFRLRCSPINDKKLKILINSLEKIPLTELDFSYCNLDDDCATTIGQYLIFNTTLKKLELRGNLIGPRGCEGLGCGLKNFSGELYYLGLARNPILEAGIISIGGGILGTKNVQKFDLTGCNLGSIEGGYLASKIIGFHNILLKYYLTAIPLGDKGGEKIIDALATNRSLIELDIRACGLHLNQMIKIRVLINRNVYFAENPCLNKSFILPEDVPTIEAWLTRVKNPILLKLQERPDSIDSFNVLTRKTHYDHKTIPKFISPNQQKIPTNDELLGLNYIDGFGDRTVKFETSEPQHQEPMFKEPNEFNDKEFGDQFIIGCNVNLQTQYYFR